MTTYALGATARLRGIFKDEDGVPADPTGITVRVLPPNGVIASYQFSVNPVVVREGPGVYTVDVSLNQEGRWRYRWEGSGDNATAAEGTLDVEATEFA